MIDFTLSGRVAVVTGSGQGLGRGFAIGLSLAGATVICAGRNQEKLAETLAEIQSRGGQAESILMDVTQKRRTAEALASVHQRHGRLDILVNNAGVEEINDFVEVTEEQYDLIMGTNLKAVFFTAQAAAKLMIPHKSGKIINVGSLGSAIGLAKSSVYCGSKGGVLQLTRTMAIELAAHNIQVNALGPGYFRTPMTEPFFVDPDHNQWIRERIPAGRVGTVEDLWGPVVFLAGQASDYLTGQILYVDGGWLAS